MKRSTEIVRRIDSPTVLFRNRPGCPTALPRQIAATFAIVVLAFGLQSVCGTEPARPFRTDADGRYSPAEWRQLQGKGRDQVLQWYRLREGEFPPSGSAHAIAGELIWSDKLERRFHLRVDRDDTQDRSHWDLPLDAYMLPYGSIFYHGSPAALEDIPIGTHLRGLFYWRAEDDLAEPPDTQNQRSTPDIDFRRCFRLEDDFSYHARQQQVWQIEQVDLQNLKLTARLIHDGPLGDPGSDETGSKQFDLLTSTRVWQQHAIGSLNDLRPGQCVLFNLTWATLYGPGQMTHIWIDQNSRQLAAELQRQRHLNHIRQRGLAGWVTDVDNQQEIITVLFFDGVDEELLAEVGSIQSLNSDDPPGPAGVAVARESLMTYDPVNDRKRGRILEINRFAPIPGSSGLQVRLKMDLLLEGYRPNRVVRYYPAHWPVRALPREEQYFGRE
jgi:hypothetical protein